jgi:putative transcriptional regulator
MMGKRKSTIGDDLIEGMTNAVAVMRRTKKAARHTVVHVRIPDRIDVAAIRRKLGLSQAEFAARFGFSVKTLQNWEQGGREPKGPARAYLIVIDRAHRVVERVLSAA